VTSGDANVNDSAAEVMMVKSNALAGPVPTDVSSCRRRSIVGAMCLLFAVYRALTSRRLLIDVYDWRPTAKNNYAGSTGTL